MPAELILPLSGPLSVAEAGGKAAALGELLARGQRVPPGFCITTAAYRAFLEANSVRIPGAASGREDLRPFAARVRQAIERGTMPPTLTELLGSAMSDLSARGHRKFAVRSSATVEDGTASFAGLFATHLNVETNEGLLSRVREVWASLWSDTAVDWLARQSAAVDGLAMAVLVQPMIEARFAGVAFTANPSSGSPWEVVVQVTRGLGEGAVSGEAVCDVYVLDDETFTFLERREQSAAGHRAPDDLIERIARTAVGIQEVVGQPQDVEWAFDDAELWILQSRRVNALPRFFPRTTEPLPAGGTWALEFSDPFSPLGRSLERRKNPVYTGAVAAALGVPFTNERREIGGFIYHREQAGRSRWLPGPLNRLWRVADAFARSSAAARRFREEAVVSLAGRIRAAEDASRSARTATEHLHAIEASVAAYLQFERDAVEVGVMANTFAPILFRWVRTVAPSLDPVETAELLGGLANRTDARNRELRALVSEAAAAGVRLRPADIRGMADDSPEHRAITRLRAFAAEYAYVWADGNVKDPAWDLNPELFDRTVAHGGVSSAPAGGSRAEQVQRRLDAALRHRLIDRLVPVRGAVFRTVLRHAKRVYPCREDYNHYLARAVMAIRAATLALGGCAVERGWLRRVDDVFMLSFEELGALAEGRAASSLGADVDARRREWRRARRLVPPKVLGAGSRTPLPAPADLNGTPGSAGRASGPARVVRTHAQLGTVRPGEILVCDVLRPDWSFVLSYVAGLVCDRGYLLSHAANLAREAGIPAVMGCARATESIRDGETIDIDGATGVVRRGSAGPDVAASPAPERRRRIAFVVRQLGFGGNERQLLDLTRHLAPETFECVVIPLRGGGAMEPAFAAQGTVVRALGEGARLTKLFRLYRVLADFRPDIVHAFDAVGGAYARVAACAARVPTVISGFGAQYIPSRSLEWSERVLAPLTSAVICNNTRGQRRIVEVTKLPVSRVPLVPNGIDVDRITRPGSPPTLRRDLAISPEVPLVGMVGKLSDDKDPINFVAAAALVHETYPGARFCFVGSGSLEALVRARIDHAGLRDVVFLMPERADGPAIPSELDVCVLSSRAEGLPNVLLEYMAWGRPIVTTDVGDAARVVGDAALVVPRESAPELASAIERLLADPALAATLAARARVRVRSAFSIEQYVQRVLDVYAGVEAPGPRLSSEPLAMSRPSKAMH